MSTSFDLKARNNSDKIVGRNCFPCCLNMQMEYEVSYGKQVGHFEQLLIPC